MGGIVVKEMVVNERQLRLLFNSKFQTILAYLTVPRTPGQLANILAIPPGTLHYRLNRLIQENLVQKVAQIGRTSTFQIIAAKYVIPPELFSDLQAIDLARTKAELRHLQKRFVEAVEKYYARLQVGEEISLSFGETPSIQVFTPQLRTWEMPVEAHEFEALLENPMAKIKSGRGKLNKEMTCKLIILLFPRTNGGSQRR
jgi:hypothetical protein